MEKKLIVSSTDKDERLDRFLQKNLQGISRTKIHTAITEGAVSIDGVVKKPSYRLKENQEVFIRIKESESPGLKPFAYNLKVLFEDDEVIVIDKPQGISVHPASEAQQETIVNALLHMRKSLSTINPQRAGIVHRLDKETSGVMVVAKNNVSHLNLVAQFRDRKVKKEYLAIVWGKLAKDHLVVDMPMKRDEHNRLKMKISFINSKQAYTDIEVKERFADSVFLLLRPRTGRMHQIRVHLKFLGCPIIGDKKYGLKDEFTHLFLHAHTLGFFHPTRGEFVEFSAPVPERFEQYIEAHRLSRGQSAKRK